MIKYRNKDGIKFMMDNNLVERKSSIVEFPNIPREFMWDFIRGYFDGNGSLILHKTPYNVYGQISITSGSSSFVSKLQDFLTAEDIESHIYKDGRDNHNAIYLRVINKRNVYKFCQNIYMSKNEFPYLERKYQKYITLLNFQPKYKSSNRLHDIV